jgi:hypothetical protein
LRKRYKRIKDEKNQVGPGLPVETFEYIFEPYDLLSCKKPANRGFVSGL